ncbi:MAG: DnaB-like helicase N-terminal domain-containing protein, partial [Acidothermaceae bacterium]
MLLSKDAIADVVEAVHGADFYRPAHQTVFDVVLDLYGRGEPADAITVAAELTKRGEIARVGGAAYLHTLMSSVPTAANAGYYAKIVAEKAILRRLVEAGTRIVQLGYAGSGGEVDDIVDRAQAAIYDVTERRTTEDYSILESLLQPTMDEIEASGQRGGGMTGVPTGFSDLDSLTNGLHPGQLVVIAGRPAMGKALALDTPLATPTGWTTMGEVAVGDLLIDADGLPTRVIAATEVLLKRPCYRVEFDDGSVIVADEKHQWLTETRSARRSAAAFAARRDQDCGRRAFAAVHTTAEIAATLRCQTADARLNHCVPNAYALDLPDQQLPLPPYALGVWLGDGHAASARYTSDDPEIAMHVEDSGLDVIDESLAVALRSIGVLDNKHIPDEYLRGSIQQRRDLLAGLLDTDGTVSPTGAV